VSARTRERVVIDARVRRRAVLSAIRGARARLVLSIFRADDRLVLQELANAARRGVCVRVLMTPRARSAAKALDALHAGLASHGIHVRRYAGGMKYHAKYLVADGTRALVTTANHTARCFERTCDFALVTRDAAMTTGLCELFDADWHARPARLTAAQRARLVVGPEGDPRERFVSIVNEARHRLCILDSRLDDPRVVEAIAARRLAGVTVERARRRDVRPLRRHGTLLIAGQAVAVLGSSPLSTHALDGRRELAVVIRDPGLVAELDSFWRTHLARRSEAAAPAKAATETRP
jgi:phosphatidylserine/phosphatidylglycerophosphate/cardiolipin synthase-like enzyme